jgi:hypothetical protein
VGNIQKTPGIVKATKTPEQRAFREISADDAQYFAAVEAEERVVKGSTEFFNGKSSRA